MKPIIHPLALFSILKSAEIVLIDARAGADSNENYELSHLEGALRVDPELELASPMGNAALGGRHPLPSPEDFSKVLQKLGVDARSHVVVYDDKNGSNAAARFWWMLRSAGIEKVQVLDGGFNAAVAIGFPVSSSIEVAKKSEPYVFERWQLPVMSMEEVETVSSSEEFTMIDVRDANRFRGEVEPIDIVAGHIPGATNLPFSSNLDANGFFKSAEELYDLYSDFVDGKDNSKIIVHCGSGITACHTLLAMDYAGLGIPNLYVGSWSEWSRNGKAIATGLI